MIYPPEFPSELDEPAKKLAYDKLYKLKDKYDSSLAELKRLGNMEFKRLDNKARLLKLQSILPISMYSKVWI